ncbi:MAG: hypothetical protein M3R52_09430 [Acidobacteriota bacterium]|nr:hypothetical protein [Acidobacteriota bacterium]
MRRNANRQSEPVANGTSDAITQYLAVLKEVYPAAKGTTRVAVKPDRRVIVSTPLPTRSRERMRLFDQMAEIGTRLLLETGEYIILSGQ